jgi:DNA-binding NtrC family response regulator
VDMGGSLRLDDLAYRQALFFETIMKNLRNKSVLVVDDDPAMLRAMTKVLANEGMRVTGLSDSTGVVTKLAESETRFDLVITDLRMPMFSGRGVLALASALSELPVIIITAFGGPDVEAQALQLGAVAFLEKPVAAAELIDVVKRALERAPSRKI